MSLLSPTEPQEARKESSSLEGRKAGETRLKNVSGAFLSFHFLFFPSPFFPFLLFLFSSFSSLFSLLLLFSSFFFSSTYGGRTVSTLTTEGKAWEFGTRKFMVINNGLVGSMKNYSCSLILCKANKAFQRFPLKDKNWSDDTSLFQAAQHPNLSHPPLCIFPSSSLQGPSVSHRKMRQQVLERPGLEISNPQRSIIHQVCAGRCWVAGGCVVSIKVEGEQHSPLSSWCLPQTVRTFSYRSKSPQNFYASSSS